jgi:hypothetical protein
MRLRFLIGTLLMAAIATAPVAASAARARAQALNPKVAAAFVKAEARALCLVETKAYPTPAAQHAAYLRAERPTHLSTRELARAQALAAHDAALRNRISKRVATTCVKH